MEKGYRHITKFKLKGYKSIKDVSGEFHEGLNIIIGNNGSGKSNLLSFLYKILNRNYTELELFSADVSIVDEFGQTFRQTAEGRLRKISNVTNTDIEIKESKTHIPVQANLISFETPKNIYILSEEYNPQYSTTDKRFTYAYKEGNYSSLLIIALWLKVSFNEVYLMEVEDFERLTEDRLLNLLQESFDKFHPEVKEQIKKYTPIQDIKLSNSIRIVKVDSTTYEFRNLIFEYKLDEEWFPWNALSDGTKRLIYVLFSINDVKVFAPPNRGIETPIVFFEEPELGIHPHQLHLLMTLLKERSEKQQIIITTHSPQVLDVLGADDLHRIFITEIDPEKGTILRKMTKSEIAKAKAYLKDEGMLSDYWRFSDFQRSKVSM